MKIFFGRFFKKYMIKPTIYKLITKILLSVTVVMIWDRYVNRSGFYNTRVFMSFVLAVVFGAAAWFSFLKLDGMTVVGFPKREKKKKPKQSTASIGDHLDTEPDAFANLLDEEKTFCGFASSLILMAVCLILSLIP